MKERLQKILARAGYGSRRHIEDWIRLGRLTINGRVASLGDCVDEKDRIALDGKTLEVSVNEPTRVLLYHKPAGEVCSRVDEEGRPTVFESLPRLRAGKWLNIGRLDFNTSGLLLFTNDGDLAHKLMHPSANLEREYAVRIYGDVNQAHLKLFRQGVLLEDGMARFSDIQEKESEGRNHWFHVVVTEGRNRLVRRVWESQGYVVSRLIRVRYGFILLERDLRPRRPRELKGKELQKLFEWVGFKPRVSEVDPRTSSGRAFKKHPKNKRH